MALIAHLEELAEKHYALKKRIAAELAPTTSEFSTDFRAETRKLRVKDELARLKYGKSQVA